MKRKKEKGYVNNIKTDCLMIEMPTKKLCG